MALTTRYSNVAVIAALDAVTALIDVSGPGTIELRTGAEPTNCIDGDSGSLLATLTFAGTAFQNATDADPGATANANTIVGDSDATGGGDAGHFRVKDGLGVVVTQGSVGTSGADMNLDTVTINNGDTVDLSDWDITLPEI
jgi:hypothetical protein